MSKINYQALREIAKQATQGEWSAFISPGTGTYAVHTPGDKRCEDVIKWTGFDGQKNAENNARYIAAFNPEVVQTLLDENERMCRDLIARNGEIEWLRKWAEELEAREVALPVASCIVEDGEMCIDGFGEYVGHSLPDGRHELYAAPPMPTLQAALERLRTIVADPRALPRRKEWISGQQYSYVLLENVEAMVDEACRTAMLQGKGGE